MRSSQSSSIAALLLGTFSMLGAAGAEAQEVAPPQSGITLYGTVDAFLYSRRLAGEGRVHLLEGGGLTNSFFGVRGTEDLGGGSKVEFDLSSFFSADTGGAGRNVADRAGFFARSAWVGLSSVELGSVRLGRLPTPTFLNLLRFDPYAGSPMFGLMLHTYLPSAIQPLLTPNGFVGNNSSGAYAGGDSAWSNSVAYSSPLWNGFSTVLQYAADEGGEAPSAGRRRSAALFYGAGAFAAGLSMDHIDRSSGLLVRTPTDSAGPPYVVNDLSTTMAGISYDFTTIKIFGQINSSRLGLGNASPIRLDTTQVGATVPLGPGKLLASFIRTDRRQADVEGKSRRTLSLGYDYVLSRRTDAYIQVLNDRATGLRSGMGYATGIRHRF